MTKSKINWTDYTWNPITGCTPISTGCKNCYARRMATRLAGRCGYDKDEPFKVTWHDDKLYEPLHLRKPSVIFVCSMGDLFHKDVPVQWIDMVFASMTMYPQHHYIILTKRSERMCEYSHYRRFPENVYAGSSVEDQPSADLRLPWLLKTKAAHRFVSVEPMIEDIDIVPYIEPFHEYDPLLNRNPSPVNQVILGGESGPGARLMHPNWARRMRDECEAAAVPFYFKQWGAKYITGSACIGNAWHDAGYDHRHKTGGRTLDGRTHDDLIWRM